MSPIVPTVLVLFADDHLWFDSQSVIDYMRKIEIQAEQHFAEAKKEHDFEKAVAAHASKELARQIADGFVLTTMSAQERIRVRRESQR